MSDTLFISTRKGLFTVSRRAEQWEITGADFLGDNVSITLTDRRNGRHYAALDHGHFGVKLHRSTATGWEEITAPTYPPKPDGYEEYDMWSRPLNWSTARIWALEAGGPDEPGVIWSGTLPGGLFRSTDHGQSWEMIRSGIIPSASNGWGVGPIYRASIRSASIHAIHGACGSRSRPGVSGSARMPVRAGHSAGRACAPSTCHQN